MVSISFDNPIYLWYLLSIPLLFYTHFYLFRHSRAQAIRFANFEALKRVTGDKLITKNITILVIRILILACVIIAASGAVVWYEGRVNEKEFVIALDTSVSMAAQDVEPNRLDAAKEAANNFVDELTTRAGIGVISFSGTTVVESVPIDNKQSIKKIINNVDTSRTGGTDLSGAIITSTNLLLTTDKSRTIILLTDGSNTVGAFIRDSIENSAAYAAENHVTVHAIGIGSEQGPIGYLPEYYNVSAVFNEQTLVQLTNMTGGEYFKANNKAQLEEAYDDINQASMTGQIDLPLSHGLMLFALFLLFLEWGLISTRFRKVP